MTDHGLFDIHCHLIPGVDDGAQDLEETRKLLRMEYEQGVRNIIATPHYRDQMFDTPIRTVRSQFALVEKCVQEFNQELAKEDRMRIYLGCEFHANMQMSRMLDEGRVSTMADSGYVLVEFSGNAEYSYAEEIISLGIDTNSGDLRETIADHTTKIIQENEGKLIKNKGVGKIYSVTI